MIQSLNSRTFERLEQSLHQDVSFGVFETSVGEFREIQGIQEVIDLFKFNFGASTDVIIDIRKLICEAQTICIFGFLRGSTWLNIGLDESFVIKFFGMIEFEAGKIKHFEWLPDTFAVLRLNGRASFKMENRDKINQYLDNLVEMGLIKRRYGEKKKIELGKLNKLEIPLSQRISTFFRLLNLDGRSSQRDLDYFKRRAGHVHGSICHSSGRFFLG